MAVTVSLINMKGGVGKTWRLSWLMADIDNLRVLAVDLDPQSNLSHSVMGPRDYAGGQTAHHRWTDRMALPVQSISIT